VDQSNLAHWESLAAFHGRGNDRYYDIDRLVAGGTLMGAEEAAALDRATAGRGVGGLDVAHLQCHLGCDAITMARAGASVTGIDFSPTALLRLGEIAASCGVDVATVEADSRDLPTSLDGSFDLVYASVGVLGWIDDLDAWMRGVSRVLRPGGQLVLVELHPLLTMIDDLDPLVLDFPYNFDGPHEFSGTGSYANRDADVSWTTVQYAHGLAEVVTSAQRAALRLTYLEEHTSMSFDPRGVESMSGDPDGRFRVRLGRGSSVADDASPGEAIPVLYTLIATREGARTPS
jgi:SAM-dependent methyltransferase